MDCAAHWTSLSFTISQNFLKLMTFESVMPSNHLILCHPLLLLPSIFPSIRVFSNEWALCIRWQKYWSFNFSISPSKEYSGLISFRMDWFDLLAVQQTLKSLLQHHSSKASVLWHSAFFMVQLSHPYMTARKTIALPRRTFVGKVMSLLFNMQSRSVMNFFPRNNHLLISWLQSPSVAGSQNGESRPWQRSWGKGPDKTQRWDQASKKSSWAFLSIYPQNQSLPCFTVLCFPPTLLTLTGGCPPTIFFWKKLI